MSIVIFVKSNFTFKTKVWLYPGAQAAWHFVSVPRELSAEIKSGFGKSSRGWGSLRVEVTIGKTTWKTSIFPDKKSSAYLLPLKADVRKREGVKAGDEVSVHIKIIK